MRYSTVAEPDEEPVAFVGRPDICPTCSGDRFADITTLSDERTVMQCVNCLATAVQACSAFGEWQWSAARAVRPPESCRLG